MVDWRAKFRDVAGVAGDSGGYKPLNDPMMRGEDSAPDVAPLSSPRTTFGTIVNPDFAPTENQPGFHDFQETKRIADISRTIQSGIKYYYSRQAQPDHHPKSEEEPGSDPFIEQFLMYIGEIIDVKVEAEVSRQLAVAGTQDYSGSGAAAGSNPTASSSSIPVMATLSRPGEMVFTDGKGVHGEALLPCKAAGPVPVQARAPPEEDSDSSDEDPDGVKKFGGPPKFTDNKYFQFVTLSIIGANTIVIALEAHYIANKEKQAFFRKIEFWFCVAYITEIILRLKDWGASEFFWGHNCAWNWFDFSVTIMGSVTIFMATFGISESSGTSVIRIFRMLRMLRIFRAMKFIKDIEEVIMHAFKATMKLFFIAFIVVFIFGIMFCNLLWDTGNPVISASFGNLELAMWSMFRLMTMDNWVKLIEPTIEFNPNFLILFILYIFLASIALMSLVPAIFVEQSMTAREHAKESSAKQEAAAQRKHDQAMLHELFQLADTDKSGNASLDELKKVIFDHEVLKRLEVEGFTEEGDISDVTLGLFDMLEHLVEEHDHTAIQTTEKQFTEGVFKQRDDDSKAASWRATTAIRMQVYRFTTKLRKDMDKIDNKIDSLRDVVQAFLSGGVVPPPRTSPIENQSSWTVWDASESAPAPGSRGGQGDACCGDPKKSPRACGSAIFG